MAGNRLMSISQDERERAVFRSRRMYQTDLQSNLATAESRGENRRALAITKNLLSMGLPLDQVITATGLARGEVEGLSIDE